MGFTALPVRLSITIRKMRIGNKRHPLADGECEAFSLLALAALHQPVTREAQQDEHADSDHGGKDVAQLLAF